MNRTLLTAPLALAIFLAPLFPAYGAAIPSHDLYVGMRGAEVTALQTFLIEKKSGKIAESLAAVGATGYFGLRTRQALAEFQAVKGISPAHGYFGAKTRAAIASDTVSIHAPTFTGSIESVNTGCFADGICSVTVDGKEVILLAGLRMSPPPVGMLKGVESIGDLENMIGASAAVYAATTTEGDADYTLYGSTDYYVMVTPKVVGEPITVEGTVGCLPPKDTSKPVIMMCAFGLKATNGVYYALSDKSGDVSSFDSDTVVKVSGTFSKGEHATWKSIGTIEVSKVEEAR